MIPSAINSVYPKFVPNQVLTSDNLNELFGYLDEQQRITRTNLLGIGIVCGLEVKYGTDPDGTYIVITKGCGVTSQGYLVTVPEIKYHYYNQFDAVKCKYYDRFVNISAKTQKLPLWELKQKGEVEDADNPFHLLNDPASFLNNKVVMIFVELLETNNKNCDPDSCDDKGTMVAVNFRPLLVLKSDAEKYLSNIPGTSVSGNALALADIKMPRFDVDATLLLDTEDVFQAYQKVLTNSFITSVKTALSDSWTRLNALFSDDFPSDPFSTFETKFAFLNDGSITPSQALNLQYFYDFFSDLLFSYDELRRKSFDVVCECVPDENLFPRHLLLGEAVGFDELNSHYRTRFIYSPVLCCCADDANTVRSLFKRLVLMVDNLSLMNGDNEEFRKRGTSVKITPSLLGKEPLSEKAIPFYYRTNSGASPLYLAWNRNRTEMGTAHRILSGRSYEYNTADDFVKFPLKYDLEPYNFLRVEGHVGQDYRSVLADISSQKQSQRLPVDVIALSSDTRGIFNITRALSTMDTTGSVAAAFEILVKHPACFSDIFLALDEWINKLRCCLLDNKRYFGQLPSFQTRAFMADRRAFVAGAAAGDATGDTEFTIEKLYEEKLKAGTINDKFCGDVFVDISTNKAHFGSALVVMPYKIDSLISILPEHITDLDARALESKYEDLNGTALQLRNLYASKNVADTMTGVDLVQLNTRLEMNCLVCLFIELRLLVREFLIRLLALMIRQKLGFYAYKNPGIQHKAGVPMGGTFILVYHEITESRRIDSNREILAALRKVNTKAGTAATGIFSGDQALLSSILLLEEFLFMQKVMAVSEEPNDVLDRIVETIKPGTVIADFYVPYLCCSDCPPAQMIVLPSPEVPNQPPIARAGDTISIQLPVSTVTLDGTNSSDPDGTIQTYLWEQSGGPGTATFQDPASAKTDVSGLIAGEYVFKLTVTDNDGAVGEDKVTVKVSEKPNIAPVAIATTDKPLVTLGDNVPARLIGDSSVDPDGTIDAFTWVLKSGNAAGTSIETPNASSSNVRFFQPGVYVFTLTVTDDRGATASADISIVVQEAHNNPPVADAGPDQAVTITPAIDFLVLDGSHSFDPDGDPLTFKWDFVAGPATPVILNADQPQTKVTDLVNGEYKFMLTVQDDKGASSSDTVSYKVIKEEVVKSCGPLADIISEFENFKKLVNKNPSFKEVFSSYNDVVKYFRELAGLASKPVDVQIEFFAAGFMGLSTQDLLMKWLNELQKIILDIKDFRLLALILFRILNLLAMYIVCIQKEDFDNAKVPMIAVFDFIMQLVGRWVVLIRHGDFSPEEIDVVKNMIKDIENELNRVDANGETAIKAHYVEFLRKILDILNSAF